MFDFQGLLEMNKFFICFRRVGSRCVTLASGKLIFLTLVQGWVSSCESVPGVNTRGAINEVVSGLGLAYWVQPYVPNVLYSEGPIFRAFPEKLGITDLRNIEPFNA